MTAPEVRVWSVTPGLLSEGPRWHEERQELLWVDIPGCQMHRGTLSSDGALEPVEAITVDRHIGAVAPALGERVRARGRPGFLFVDETGSVRELAQAEAGHTEVRMNDGACDPMERCGHPPVRKIMKIVQNAPRGVRAGAVRLRARWPASGTPPRAFGRSTAGGS